MIPSALVDALSALSVQTASLQIHPDVTPAALDYPKRSVSSRVLATPLGSVSDAGLKRVFSTLHASYCQRDQIG